MSCAVEVKAICIVTQDKRLANVQYLANIHQSFSPAKTNPCNDWCESHWTADFFSVHDANCVSSLFVDCFRFRDQSCASHWFRCKNQGNLNLYYVDWDTYHVHQLQSRLPMLFEHHPLTFLSPTPQSYQSGRSASSSIPETETHRFDSEFPDGCSVYINRTSSEQYW